MPDIPEDNVKLVEKFGASLVSELKDVPDFYAFRAGLLYSHRDFEKFLKAAKAGKPTAIVSGLNASGTIHIGHKVVFDTNLYFQKTYGSIVYIPISDDESYVAKKVDTQAQALENALKLAKQLLAYGFDPKKTHIIIDQIYTDIYNHAIRLSRRLTLSEIKAVYGYGNDENIGLHFYPTIQAAHVTFPQVHAGIKEVLVPIGPDEDSHLRSARDAASREGLEKPRVIHSIFLPGTDGEKMSKSRGNAIYLEDSEKQVRKKVMAAFSGGQVSVEEHRKIGGDPHVDVACQYLSWFYLSEKESAELFKKYRAGELLSGEVKQMLFERLWKDISTFQEKVKEISDADVQKVLLKNANQL